MPLVFTKKHGIYAAKRMLHLRLTFANRTYYTMAPRSGPVSYTHLDVYKRQGFRQSGMLYLRRRCAGRGGAFVPQRGHEPFLCRPAALVYAGGMCAVFFGQPRRTGASAFRRRSVRSLVPGLAVRNAVARGAAPVCGCGFGAFSACAYGAQRRP